MAEINKKSLEYLVELARLAAPEYSGASLAHSGRELSEKGLPAGRQEAEKFLADLQRILEHFKELQEVNTDNVQPMAGGTELKNVTREDEIFKKDHYIDAGKIIEQFPEQERGYLKIPSVFEDKT